MINYGVLTLFVLANRMKPNDDAATGFMLLGILELLVELVMLIKYL
jgi:hypothetical protein